MKKKLKKIKSLLPKLHKRLSRQEKIQAEVNDVLRITNDTVAEHREKVLSRARKYIYPLQHSKHRIVIISSGLFVFAVVVFVGIVTADLYYYKTNSDFIYGVTKVIPYPVARSGSSFISYENYLFELRHYTHYYETQQKKDLSSGEGRKQLEDYKKRALEKVVNDALVKQLASKNKISVSERELNDLYVLVRNQNRLGANEKGFEDVIRANFGWSVSDFKRELKQQLLVQKVIAALDTAANDKARVALAEIRNGADFAAIAQKYSDDQATKSSGGDYGQLVDKANRDIPPQVTNDLFKLSPGQVSNVINTGFTLEIVKNIDNQGDKIHAAHIVFKLKDINTFLVEVKSKQKTRTYIKV